MKRRNPFHKPVNRWAQTIGLAGFLYLFLRTAYWGVDDIRWPVHMIFRLDPLAVLAEGMAGHWPDLAGIWLGAVVALAAAILLGRFFCGYLCPLGAILDFTRGPLRRWTSLRKSRARPHRRTNVMVLAGLFVGTLLGLPLLGLFDPLSVTLRTLALSLFPVFDRAAKGFFNLFYRLDLPVVTDYTEVANEYMRESVFSLGQPLFIGAGVTFAFFVAIAFLELVAPRFWCTHLCPLGTLLGLAGRFSPLGRKKAADCGICTGCSAVCPTGAADGEVADRISCIQCGECERACQQGAMKVELMRPPKPSVDKGLRRGFLASAATGFAVALVSASRGETRELSHDFIRPPGSLNEDEFTKRCIRCGACMRVCPTNGLHPALGEAGWEGLWTPRFDMRIGYCEYHCRLCGQVCPTGAIDYLEKGQKERTVVGIAIIERDRCLPFRKAEQCLVCEEHCPTNPKAIKFEEGERTTEDGVAVKVKLPRVLEKECVGCGICENKCPLPGKSAIRVVREKPGMINPYG